MSGPVAAWGPGVEIGVLTDAPRLPAPFLCPDQAQGRIHHATLRGEINGVPEMAAL